MADQLPNPDSQVLPFPAQAPIDPDLGPGEWIAQQRQRATAAAFAGLDSDPSEAADALQIARNSNVPASVAALDTEKIKQQQKAAIVASLLENNQTLRDYALGHPLAPKISANDWGQLDAISAAYDKLNPDVRILPGEAESLGAATLTEWVKTLASGTAQVAIEAAKGASSAVPQRPLFSFTPEEVAGLTKYGMTHPISGLPVLGGATVTRTVQDFGSIIGGLVTGAIKGGAEFYHQLSGIDESEKANTLLEVLSDPGLAASLGPFAGPVEAISPALKASLHSQVTNALRYIRENKPVPFGVSEITDQIHVEQAKADAKNLTNFVRESGRSETRSLDPEFFADQFLRRKTNASILVDADAVRKLYGNKVPAPDDNILGWVKGIQDQLAVAEEDGGGKIAIPIADWTAHIPDHPEVVDALKDDIQFRPGGVTLNEAKELGTEAPKVEGKAEGEKPIEEVKPEEQVVSALRQQTKLQPPTDVEPLAQRGEAGAAPTEQWIRLKGARSTHFLLPTERWTDKEAAVMQAMEEYFNKIAPSFEGSIAGTRGVRIGGQAVHAGYVGLAKDAAPVILYSLFDPKGNFKLPEDLLHTVRHETMHWFRRSGRLTDEEWNTLTEAAERDGWIEKHDIAERYEGASHELQIEESIAEEFGKWNLKPESTHIAAKTFQKLRDILLQLRDIVIDKMGFDPKVEDLFHKIESGEVGAREYRDIGAEAKPAAQKIEKGSTNLSGQIARLLGKERGTKYLESMAARDAEDAAFQAKLAEARARQQQTSEWKANRQSMRTEVSEDIRQRPAVAADLFFRNGELYGEKIRKPHLDRAAVPAELRKAIPPDYLIDRGGIHPDTAAGFFGYQTGRSMLEDLARLHADREEAGLTPSAHLTSMIEAETDRRMTATYGTLDQSILEEAKDHILGPSELDRLHEEMMALDAIHQGGGGEQMSAAEQLTWNKQAVKARVRENVASGRYGKMGEISSDHFVDQIGRIGKRIEDALQDGEYHDAFKLSQQRLIAASAAAEVKKLERAKTRFDKQVPKWRQREPFGDTLPANEAALWLHQILSQIGLPARRSIQDWERQHELISQHANLREYYNEVNKAHGTNSQDPDAMPAVQNLNIMEELFSSNWRKPVEEMTPEEFMGVYNSLKSIDNWGRNAKKTEVRGNKEDTEKVVSGLVERLKAAVADKPAAMSAEDKSKLRTVGSLLLNPETWFNRLDLGNRLGPFNQLIVRPITEGQHTLRSLEREFAARWRDLGEPKDYNAKIENTLFRDKDGDLIPMTKGNALAVLSNMGNKLQRAKLVLGWKIDEDVARGEQKIWDWLQKVGVGPEDLARAQKLGQIFSDAFERSEAAWVHTAGVAPARIELGAMHTPWGVTEEWYHPLIPDPLRKNVKLTADDMLNESGYYRPSPSHGYTKLRTGAIYPIDLSYDSIPFKLKQILNDAAMRIPITEVNKLVYHDNFQTAFKKYYGPEYASALDGWMKDVAGNRQWVPGNIKSVEAAISGIQRNLSILQIGFNMRTVAKHAPTAAIFSMSEVGFKRFANSLLHMLYELPGSRERWEFAMDNSEELRNRLHTPSDTLTTIHHEIFPTKTTRRDSFRDTLEKYGHMPVAYTDLYSAVAMWDAEYRRLGEEKPDMSHGDKVYLANTAVRRTHGSAILSNRAGVMRYPSALARLATPYYNFFSNALQRLYEQAWKSKLALQGRSLPEMTGFLEEKFKAGPQHIKSIIGGLMVFGIMPSLIEQMVDPLPQAPGESNVKHWAKILTRGPAAMIPAVRDAVNYLYEGHDPSLGLYGTVVRNITEPLKTNTYVRDPGKAILNINRAFGALTGLTVEHFGKAGQFTANVMDGKEHPKGMGDLFTGLWKGTLKPPKRQ